MSIGNSAKSASIERLKQHANSTADLITYVINNPTIALNAFAIFRSVYTTFVTTAISELLTILHSVPKGRYKAVTVAVFV